jgi:hypothetical protein
MNDMRGLDTTHDLTDYAGLLKEKGYEFVIRYVSAAPWKCATREETEHLKAMGIRVLYVYEANPTSPEYFTLERAYTDYIAGLSAVSEFGMTNEDILFYAVDYDASEEDEERIREYFREIISHKRHYLDGDHPFPGIGVYGSGAVIQAVRKDFPRIRTWLSLSSGWRGYNSAGMVTIRQHSADLSIPFYNDTDEWV